MRIQSAQTHSNHANSVGADESRRNAIKRLAVVCSSVALGSALLAFTGCKTTDASKPAKTVPGFLEGDKPSW